jgi:hypothetical protein
MIPTDMQPVTTTSTPTRTVGSTLALVAGFSLQGAAAVLVAASGLMMPMWAVVAMWFVWLAGLAVQIRQRHRPLIVVAVPIVVAAIWMLTGTLGEAFLDWTA